VVDGTHVLCRGVSAQEAWRSPTANHQAGHPAIQRVRATRGPAHPPGLDPGHDLTVGHGVTTPAPGLVPIPPDGVPVLAPTVEIPTVDTATAARPCPTDAATSATGPTRTLTVVWVCSD